MAPCSATLRSRATSATGLISLQGAPTNNIFYVNTAYLTWAGITAGKAASFFSFVGGGDNYANFFSPDRKGFNEPLLLAYTASFGGGFSATISAEFPASVGASGGGTTINGATGCAGNGGCVGNPALITFGGQKWPDIVGALHVKQGWGEAQISGVVHNVNVTANGFDGAVVGDACGPDAFTVVCNGGSTNHVGWALDAGVKINLQGWGGMFAAGDDLLLTGAYSQSAVWYSGLLDGMWGENGQTNGNGQPMFLADSFFNPVTNQWAQAEGMVRLGPARAPLDAGLLHRFRSLDRRRRVEQHGRRLELRAAASSSPRPRQAPVSPRALSWIIGTDIGWSPVTNLNFDLELMYQATTQSAPSGFLGTVYNAGGVGGPVFVPGDWRGNSNGFAGRLRITRYF